MNWYEQLGRMIASEFGLTEGCPIEAQCGTVWVTKNDKVLAISTTETEEG